MKEEKLSQEHLDQMRNNIEYAMKTIQQKYPGLSREDPGEVMRFASEAAMRDEIMFPEASCVMIDCLGKAAGWRYVDLMINPGTGIRAVVSPDGAYWAAPDLVWQAASRNSEKNVLLAFYEALVRGNLPKSTPGNYLQLKIG
ncbi:MAG TPA: hypothetical protein PK907_03055 [Candidatus Sabulitectum sp.]|nr:hypothetical protein [Candidatus Sabulitectum sp.]